MGGVCSPQFLDARQKTCKSQKWRSGPVWQKYIIVADISSWKREAVTNLILCVLLAVRAKTSCAASSVRSRRPTTSWEVPHISSGFVATILKQESRCQQEFLWLPKQSGRPIRPWDCWMRFCWCDIVCWVICFQGKEQLFKVTYRRGWLQHLQLRYPEALPPLDPRIYTHFCSPVPSLSPFYQNFHLIYIFCQKICIYLHSHPHFPNFYIYSVKIFVLGRLEMFESDTWAPALSAIFSEPNRKINHLAENTKICVNLFVINIHATVNSRFCGDWTLQNIESFLQK